MEHQSFPLIKKHTQSTSGGESSRGWNHCGHRSTFCKSPFTSSHMEVFWNGASKSSNMLLVFQRAKQLMFLGYPTLAQFKDPSLKSSYVDFISAWTCGKKRKTLETSHICYCFLVGLVPSWICANWLLLLHGLFDLISLILWFLAARSCFLPLPRSNVEELGIVLEPDSSWLSKF